MKDFSVIFTHKINAQEAGVYDKYVLNATKNEYHE